MHETMMSQAAEEGKMIRIEAHVCDQRRSYWVTFDNARQAVDWMTARSEQDMLEHPERGYGNHAYSLDEEGCGALNPYTEGPLSEGELALMDFLFPSCEHGMSADLCMGPDHFMTAAQEYALGW